MLVRVRVGKKAGRNLVLVVGAVVIGMGMRRVRGGFIRMSEGREGAFVVEEVFRELGAKVELQLCLIFRVALGFF